MVDLKVTFEPYGRTVKVKNGENLLKAAIEAGVYLKSSCGGTGTCGGCKVKIESGELDSKRTSAITEKESKNGLVLACQSAVRDDLTVNVPENSHSLYLRMPDRELLSNKLSLSMDSMEIENLLSDMEIEPVVSFLNLEIEPPSKSDNSSDLHRLRREIERSYGIPDIYVEFDVVKKMGGILRKSNWIVTAVVVDGPKFQRVVDLRPSMDNAKAYAAAFDIGTTSVYCQLVDLASGKVAASASDYNPQIRFGEDVISRIVFSQKPGGLLKLQEAIVGLMNSMLGLLLERTGATKDDIFLVTAAGNTSMTHLLLGVDPKSIREEPYVPAARFFPPVRPGEIGLDLPEHVFIRMAPCVASYVGGDIVAGLVSSGVFDDERLTLYMDIGTNGEVVLGNREWMMSTSCSAGPAFEGGGVKSGTRAVEGAIEDVKIDPETYEPYLMTIFDTPPIGICGSGLIDLVSEMWQTGIISQDGKFNEEITSERIRKTDGGFEYLLARADETGIGQEITITDVDIDNLMRAKAAIYAGVTVLVNSLGFDFKDIERVLIAGGFGQFINVEKAQSIGLLPGKIAADRFYFVGNGSLNGARMLARSKKVFEIAENVARMVTNIELSDNPSFMEQYIAALFIPHTDASQFPQLNLTGKAGASR